MCILLAAIERHPDFPLIIFHNREEEKIRGDQTVDPAVDDTYLLQAKDKRAGGTFMSLNTRTGHFGSLTNIRTQMPPPPGCTSRGILVRQVALGTPVSEVLRKNLFSGCNLLSGQCGSGGRPSQVWLSSVEPAQKSPGHATTVRRVASGELICVSNADGEAAQAEWPKVDWVRHEAAALLQSAGSGPLQGGEEGVRQLLQQLSTMMSTSNDFDESSMPQLSSFSPYPDWKEVHLQRGPFIRSYDQWPEYGGTMMQTAILVSSSGKANYHCWRKCRGDASHGDWHISCFPWSQAPAAPNYSAFYRLAILSAAIVAGVTLRKR